MASRKAYLVTDLGFGDGGKGGVIHKLSSYAKPHTIIKVGGAQGSHGVTYEDGKSFQFSQFGCGTREGVRTHLAQTFVSSAVGLMNEAAVIKEELGIMNPFSLLTADPNMLISTSFHGLSSRLKEIARGKNARGVIGVGIGEAAADAEIFPDLAIYARDLKQSDLREKLRAVWTQKRQEIALIYEQPFMIEGEDVASVKEQLGLMRDERFFTWMCEEFERLGQQLRIVDGDYLNREIFSRDGTVIFEASHGVLTDRYYGFHPHTSRLRTVPAEQADKVLKVGGWDGDIVRLGVMRSYQVKHGAGPLVVDTPQMAMNLLPEEFGSPDRYRGQVRVGPLDLVATRYARDVCGGVAAFDALCITWCDTIARSGKFLVCNEYEGSLSKEFFIDSHHLRVSHNSGREQILRQEMLTKALLTYRPVVSSYTLPMLGTVTEVRSLVSSVMKEAVGIPVRMISMGPSDKDKLLF